MLTKMKDFVDWINEELERRGWNNSELAARGGITEAAISHLLNRRNNPGLKSCKAIARAFGKEPDAMLRHAGLLPPLPAEVEEEREAIILLRYLESSSRQSVLAMLRGLANANPFDIKLQTIDESYVQYNLPPPNPTESLIWDIVQHLKTMSREDQQRILDLIRWINRNQNEKER